VLRYLEKMREKKEKKKIRKRKIERNIFKLKLQYFLFESVKKEKRKKKNFLLF
jgi:hypothetical protein